MSKPPVAPQKIVRFVQAELIEADDLVATEEPLELRIHFTSGIQRITKTLAIIMRTPGNDQELAYGFLFTEGIIQKGSDVLAMRYCRDPAKPEESGNVLRIELAESVQIAPALFQRQSFVNSSCGVCGKTALDDLGELAKNSPVLGRKEISPVTADIIVGLAASVKNKQRIFGYTGGLHAAALFSSDGTMLSIMEDVGRHNAVDKLIGAALLGNSTELESGLLFLSGRAGFELIQKAAMNRCQIVCSVGAPTSLAVDCAQRFGITLIGFLRDSRFNIYTYPERIMQLP